MTTVVGIVGSPSVGGRTTTAVRALLNAAEDAGARTRLVELSTATTDDALAAMDAADAVIFGSPVYRAGHSALLRSLLESTQRGKYGEDTAPLRGKAAAIVMTGASGHHFLAPDGLRAVLASFFALQVLAPALYLDGMAFTPDKTLTDDALALTRHHGTAVVDLAAAVRASSTLSTMEAQV